MGRSTINNASYRMIMIDYAGCVEDTHTVINRTYTEAGLQG